jgi:hypothetical protein
MKKTETKIEGFKGFNKDMTCLGMQYTEGQEYHHPGIVKCCPSDSDVQQGKGGFHSCELSHDVFGYYAPGTSVYHKTLSSGIIDKNNDDSKIAAEYIEIGEEISVCDIVKMSVSAFFERFKFTEKINSTDTNNAGDYGAANAGNYGAAIVRHSGQASVGEDGIACAMGRKAKAKGKMGAFLILCEYDDDHELIACKTRRVNGKNIKIDTWYSLRNGKVVKVD